MLMDQVRQLQQQVSNMSQQGNNSGQNSGGNFEQFPQPNEQRILLVSNVPNSVASCDALFFMFERWSLNYSNHSNHFSQVIYFCWYNYPRFFSLFFQNGYIQPILM